MIKSDGKEMRQFRRKLSVSPITGLKGTRPQANIIPLSVWPKLSSKAPHLAFKTHVCDNIICSLLSLSLAPRENLGASVNVTLSASLVPRGHTQKWGPLWISKRSSPESSYDRPQTKRVIVILSRMAFFTPLAQAFSLSRRSFSDP